MIGVLTGKVEPVEILWTAIAITGFALAVTNTIMSHQTVRYLRRKGIANGRLVIARAVRTTELVRVTIQSIEIGLGVISMTLPHTDLSQLPLHLRLSADFIQWGLVACAALTLFQSVNSMRLRRYFIAQGK